MTRIVRDRGWLLVIVGVFACGPLRAQTFELATLATGADAASVAQVTGGARDAQFVVQADPRVRIAGGAGLTWMRLRFALSPGDDPHADPQVLRFDRVSLDRIAVWLPGATAPLRDGFYLPELADSLGPNSFGFAIPHHLQGTQTVYVAVESRARTTLTPRLVSERTYQARERTVSALLGATYASILVLMLTSAALALALRDRVQSRFVAVTLAVLVLLLAVNGHLYRLAGFGGLGAWGGYGVYALGLVASALALSFSRVFLGLEQRTSGLDRGLRWLHHGLLVLAALCLLNLRGVEVALKALAGTAVVLAGLANVAAALVAWRRGEALARAYSLVWLILAAAVALRVGVAQGWLPQQAVTLYGFQLALAFGLFLMSVGLADRVMEFRKQRDRVRQQKEQTDASLHLEQRRRAFAETLRAQLRDPPAHGDLEWVGFRRLLAALRPLLPQRASAVVAYGYHGLDLCVVEPGEAGERITTLLKTRGARLRNLCRGDAPAHLAADERRVGDPDHDGPALHYAVLPLALEPPAWGALLIERDAARRFDESELRLAADYLGLAVAATDEAMRQRELRLHAERDPLTGAHNRRAGDALLANGLRRAIEAHQPFAVLFVDIDHFKQVNDRYGHAVGDDCLRAVAQAVRGVLHAGEALVRWGGEEFLVMAPGRAPDAAAALGEAIRQAVLHLRVPNGSGELRFTVSVGVAGRLPGETEVQGLIERADRALYEAKHQGRNRVQSAPTYGYGADAGAVRYEPPPKLSI